jgi:hypothetical protein
MIFAPTLAHLDRVLAGDALPAFLANPIVGIHECDDCDARYFGTRVLTTPSCPDCLGTLYEVGVWDLRTQGWPQGHEGGAR